jgi:elongation factor P
MASPNDIKKGIVLNYEGGLWVVVDFQRVSPGKGSSFVRTRMKNLQTGKVVEFNFKSAESVTFEEVQYLKMQYLFNDGHFYTFMDNTSYEQVSLDAESIGEDAKYLKDGLEVTVVMHNGVALTIQLPKKITYDISYTEPAVKGDTAAGNVTKEAELDNGLKVKVPIFINQGESIVVNTETGEYVERVSK